MIRDFVEYQNITDYMTDGGRRYITPQGNHYPSVTTVLGKKPKPALVDWRERVGDEEADRIVRRAGTTGNALHKCCENYTLGKELPVVNPGVNLLFNALRPELNKIDVIKGVEIPLYSDYLKIAGRADCMGVYKGVMSTIDYKNSQKEKMVEWIEDYFLQGTIYAMMFMQMYRVPVKQVVIMMALWDGQKRIFVEPVAKRLESVVQLMKDFNYMWRQQ